MDLGPPPPITLLSRLILLGRDIKLSHSVFALPFALLATFLAPAMAGQIPTPGQWGLIVLCMVLARTTAMTFNRLADARLDAINPRTAGRALPSGKLGQPFMRAVCIGSALGFLVACAGFWRWYDNPWPLALAPIALLWLCGYSYAKRFTWLCHLWLGAALALSPPAATVAIYPPFLGQLEPYLLAGMVWCWVAGFDILYALQDLDVDRRLGLFSMPAKLGVEPSLWISRVLHLMSVTALVWLWLISPHLGAGFALGCILTALLLAIEHILIWRSGTHHINLAFFTLNGIISLLLGGLGIVDVLRSVT